MSDRAVVTFLISLNVIYEVMVNYKVRDYVTTNYSKPLLNSSIYI